MSLRAILVLAVLLAAVAFAVVRFRGGEAPPAASAEDLPLLAPFAEEAVRGIVTRCDDAEFALTRGAGAAWRLTSPVAADADPREVRVLVAALREARVRKAIAEKGADRGAYGLDPAACTVELTIAGEATLRVLTLGGTSPVGVERYALASDGRIVFVDGSLFTAVARPASAFVERRLLPLDPDEVARLEIERPDATIDLTRDGTAWRLDGAARDFADETQAAAAVRAATSLAVTEPAGGAPAIRAAAARRIALRVTRAPGIPPLETFVAAAGIEGKRIAWRVDGTVLGTVDETALVDLLRPAASFRNRQVLSFSVPDVRSVTLTRGGAPFRISRDELGSAWRLSAGNETPGAADGARVDALLDRLRSVRALDAVDGEAPGVATGELVIAGADGELARARWGPLPPREGTEVVWVTTPARPGVAFRVAASSFGPLPASAADLARKP